MPTWYERAEDQIDRDLADGLIDGREYQAQMRDLRLEMEGEAEEASRQAYDNAMGNW